MKPVIVSWSGGKDSTLALHRFVKNDSHRVVGLLTTVQADSKRVSMHHLHERLLRAQAKALELPLHVVYVPGSGTNTDYEAALLKALQPYKAQDITTVAFGDIFLSDIRKYREGLLEQAGMRAVFPLWLEETDKLAQQFVNLRYKAITICIDKDRLHDKHLGVPYDKAFLEALPAKTDPCGEHGEFHTFVYDGPVFKDKVPFRTGHTQEHSYPNYRKLFRVCEMHAV